MILKLGTKINIMFVLIILIGASILGFVMSMAIRGSIEGVTVEKVSSDGEMAYEYINAAYLGDWHIKNNELYKGETRINENEEVVDFIASKTNDEVTFFAGTTPVATTIRVDGERIIGENMAQSIVSDVISQNKAYYGQVEVLGSEKSTAFLPLHNKQGETIGVLYLAAPDSYVSSIVGDIVKKFSVILIFILIFATCILAVFTRYIRKRLTNVVEVLKAAGKGDFTKTLKDTSSDELGEVANSFNQMADNVKILMKDIAEHSNEVGKTSNALLKNANETAISTDNAVQAITKIVGNVDIQQSMIEQSAVAINGVTNGISTISENASTAVEASAISKEKALSGQHSVVKVVEQMAVINDSNIETNKVIQELEVRSSEIGEIIEAITAIADQTNLLALNAAIESARAGEHGKGFAVVADEVRKLAEQSRNSASLISNIVQAIQGDTAKVANLMNRTNTEIKNGMQVVEHTGTTFTEIYTSVEVAYSQIQELSAITEEMAASMQEINASFDEVAALAKSTSDDANVISEVTDEQIHLAEKVMNAAEVLESQSQQLDNSIKHFII